MIFRACILHVVRLDFCMFTGRYTYLPKIHTHQKYILTVTDTCVGISLGCTMYSINVNLKLSLLFKKTQQEAYFYFIIIEGYKDMTIRSSFVKYSKVTS